MHEDDQTRLAELPSVAHGDLPQRATSPSAATSPENRKPFAFDMPAFPCLEARNAPNEGMSLRDYFAGQALIGMQAHPANEQPIYVATWAYKVADAMLAEREK